MSDCGCNNTSGETIPTPDYLLVRATGKNASKCGSADESIDPSSLECTKSDPTYDALLADFALPSDSAVPILVCNGALYSVGQWIQFVNAGATVQILSINGNEITVRAICSNGVEIDGNPTAGTIIRKNDSIIAVNAPDCLTAAEKQERIFAQLETATQLCLPALEEENSATAEMQVAGWKRSDPDDSSFRKCIKRIASFFFKDGKPYLTDLDTVNLATSSSHVPLVIDKTTGKVSKQINKSINEGAFVFAPIEGQSIYTLGGSSFSEIGNWVNVAAATPHEVTLNFNISSINDLTILGDYFYVHLRINLGCWNPGSFAISGVLHLDSKEVGFVYGYYNVIGTQVINVIAKVDKSAKSLPLKLTAAGSGSLKYHCGVYLDGVSY